MPFFSTIIPEQVEVIKAINKLMEVSGFDTVKRTYAQAIYQSLKKAWAESLCLKQSSGRPCIHKLLGQKCPSLESFSLMPPYTDHPSLWLRDGKPFCLISQPYGPLAMSEIETIGKFCHRQGRTFGMVADEWFNLNAGRGRPGTKERYECIVRDHLRPLEKMPLEKVDKAQVKRLLANLLQIRAPKTVEVTHAVISGIFTAANELGYTEVNPAHGLLKRILPSKKNRVRSEPDPFNRQDLEAFLLAAWAKLPGPYPLILETMAMSGLRLGEALAMSGDNLDSRNCQYNVTETTRAGRFGPPKSGKRVIDLDEALVGKLEVHIKKMRKEGMAEGKLPGRYLFPEITQRLIQRAMQRACKTAQGRVRNPHDLRHTYATMLLMDHYSPAYVQKQLGHSSISITVDIYGHWIPGEGKMDLTRTLRGPKAKPRRPLSVVKQGQE